MNTEWMKRVEKFVLPAMGIVLFGLWILYIGLGFGFFKPWGGILGSQQPRRAECDLNRGAGRRDWPLWRPGARKQAGRCGTA